MVPFSPLAQTTGDELATRRQPLRVAMWTCSCGAFNRSTVTTCACGLQLVASATEVNAVLNATTDLLSAGKYISTLEAQRAAHNAATKKDASNATRACAGGVDGSGLVSTAIKAQTVEHPMMNNRREWRASWRILRRDVEVKRVLANASSRVTKAMSTVRQSITQLTPRALGRMVKTARNLPDLGYMVTLTYPGTFSKDGAVVKKHLKYFRDWLVRTKKARGFWFLEFQERGAPHFHLYLDKYVDFREIRERWFEIVGSGDQAHRFAGTRVEQLREAHAMAAYAEKYCAKKEQKQVPEDYQNVGRFWGKFGGLKVEELYSGSGPLGNAAASRTGEVSVAPALRVIEHLYRQDRAALRAKGVPAKVPTCGWGTRSWTAWGLSGQVATAMGRLGFLDLNATDVPDAPPLAC